jgi:hypothetical protein
MYWIKRKISQIKNVIKWLPTIWNQFDFDYNYSIDVFKFQLEKQAEYLESEKARTRDAKDRAKRIRTTLKLMKKVYDEEYAMEYSDKMEELYGKDLMKYELINTGRGDGTSYYQKKYERTETPERIKEIKDVSNKLFTESNLKQEKAHRIVWLMVERNIQGWWD